MRVYYHTIDEGVVVGSLIYLHDTRVNGYMGGNPYQTLYHHHVKLCQDGDVPDGIVTSVPTDHPYIEVVRHGPARPAMDPSHLGLWNPSVRDQGNIGSSTGHATAAAAEAVWGLNFQGGASLQLGNTVYHDVHVTDVRLSGSDDDLQCEISRFEKNLEDNYSFESSARLHTIPPTEDGLYLQYEVNGGIDTDSIVVYRGKCYALNMDFDYVTWDEGSSGVWYGPIKRPPAPPAEPEQIRRMEV